MKQKQNSVIFSFLIFGIYCVNMVVAQSSAQAWDSARIRLAFGHTSEEQTEYQVSLVSASKELKVSLPVGMNTEDDDKISDESFIHFGQGDIDELYVDVSWHTSDMDFRRIGLPNTNMWRYFFDKGSPGQSERLLSDPWRRPDAPILTIQLNAEGTLGFSVGILQLLQQGAMWLPELDIYISLANNPMNFEEHLASLTGQRVLEHIKMEPDATLDEFKTRWTDFGNPLISDPSWENWQTKWMGTTGHLIVTAAAHGSIYKFAIDRFGNVRPDFASPHVFSLDLSWKGSQWEMQKIENGLPVIVTGLKKNGRHCHIEQFAAPFNTDPDAGCLPGLLLTKVKFTGEPGAIDFGISFNSQVNDRPLQLEASGNGSWMITDKQTGDILLMLDTESGFTLEDLQSSTLEDRQHVSLTISGDLAPDKSSEFIIKLPSPGVERSQINLLKEIAFASAKKEVENYWNGWLDKGAWFEVPEEKINQLFRANLWHALVLPRHTTGSDKELHMDIPYANTAYGQKNADWPINQAVYVDYMIYGLRGYEEVAENELTAMFKTQQQPNGRIGGYADWGVYSPGQLYAIAQNYLLSRNDRQFERLLPYAIKTMEWCLAQITEARNGAHNHSGLILAALNDLSPEKHEWAFTQAYFVGGLELFGSALMIYGHERAKEVLEVAAEMQRDVVNAFSKTSVQSPVVQLADGTWINYISTDAMTPRRLIDQWYPTDVDTGPLHLSRLGVFEPDSWQTTAMLNDYEDNLFFQNQGTANEPVYIPQANTYLLRDDPKAAIRSFYSMTACAFSHEQLTSLEHRWAHPVYYGPPSTDGAWFEIYRKMLLNEWGMDTLCIGQAIPRNWLTAGKKVTVKNAPSYFGPISFIIDGENSESEIVANIDLSDRDLPEALLIRFRHPESLPIRAVWVNGEPWKDFSLEKEMIRITKPQKLKLEIKARYE